MPPPLIEEIVEQHFDEASFLWSQRDAAVLSSLYTLDDMEELDGRIEAHLDGLRVAGGFAWELCENGLDDEDPGTLFTSAMMAFESGIEDHIELVVKKSALSRPLFKAAVSALGWLNPNSFRPLIRTLVSSQRGHDQCLGIAACGVRRIDPRVYLKNAIESPNQFLRLNAFKTAGVLKRLDLLPELQHYFKHENPAVRFEACRAALLMGDLSALEAFSPFAATENPFTVPALDIALRLTDPQTALKWLKAHSSNPEQRRLALICTGIVGDPRYIPMLIRQMTVPALARAAGAAFSMITGVILGETGLEREQPEAYVERPDDNPENEDVLMDPDEDLPWPDAEKTERWWTDHQDTFVAGKRYLAGHPITERNCMKILTEGNQLQRHAAALEITLHKPEELYFNIKAPAFRTR
jgi:uncharacterized protein (TIGR02270 family)